MVKSRKRHLWAVVLTRAFRDDRYFRLFFAQGILGSIARYSFFIDEIAVRERCGLVVTDRLAIALVGIPPRLYIQRCDLSMMTRILILFQGRIFRLRWHEILESQKDNDSEQRVAYLSAIACPPEQRGAGVATSLLRQVVKFAVERKLDIVCEVSSPNLVGWYKKRGFALSEQTYIADGTLVYTLRHKYTEPEL